MNVITESNRQKQLFFNIIYKKININPKKFLYIKIKCQIKLKQY
jgi:hypothetical protein